MTFGDLCLAAYRRLKLADTPSPSDQIRIKQYINLWYRTILSRPGMDRLRDTVLSFATVNGQKFYGMPQGVQKIHDLYDLTNQRRILPRSVDYLRNVDPGITATSSYVENWIPFKGWGAELVQLTQTGVPLYAVSDNAGDTTQKVYVETVRLGGVRAGTAVSTGTTLTGTSRVQVGSQSDHIEIVKCYLDQATSGNISLYDAATNGNLLSTITIGRTSARYFMIQLYPTPGAAVTISVDCRLGMQDLVQATEEPLFPEDFHVCLVNFACYEEWKNRDDTRAKDELALGERIVSDMRHAIFTTADEIAVQKGPHGYPQRVSRLGGYFPAGT